MRKNHPQSIELNRRISCQVREIKNLEFKIFENKGEISLSDIDKNNRDGNKNDDFLKFCCDSLESILQRA